MCRGLKLFGVEELFHTAGSPFLLEMRRKTPGDLLLAPEQALGFVLLELHLDSLFELSLIARRSSPKLELQELEYSPRRVYEAQVKT